MLFLSFLVTQSNQKSGTFTSTVRFGQVWSAQVQVSQTVLWAEMYFKNFFEFSLQRQIFPHLLWHSLFLTAMDLENSHTFVMTSEGMLLNTFTLVLY